MSSTVSLCHLLPSHLLSWGCACHSGPLWSRPILYFQKSACLFPLHSTSHRPGGLCPWERKAPSLCHTCPTHFQRVSHTVEPASTLLLWRAEEPDSRVFHLEVQSHLGSSSRWTSIWPEPSPVRSPCGIWGPRALEQSPRLQEILL